MWGRPPGLRGTSTSRVKADVDVGRRPAQPPLLMCAVIGALFAQHRSTVAVPFVGYKSDGQTGPLDAPTEAGRLVAVEPKAARELAYYRAESGLGILALRGWYCFGTYGSAGDALFVTPEPIDTANFLLDRHGFEGPVIQVSDTFGDTSGRFTVAKIIARVFPAYKEFAIGVMKDFDQPANSFTFSPYPANKLTYRSPKLVEYRTPAQKEGLGTHSWLKKNDTPIDGVAILAGPTPDLVFLAMRLPTKLNWLTPVIIGQVEELK